MTLVVTYMYMQYAQLHNSGDNIGSGKIQIKMMFLKLKINTYTASESQDHFPNTNIQFFHQLFYELPSHLGCE